MMGGIQVLRVLLHIQVGASLLAALVTVGGVLDGPDATVLLATAT